MNKKFVIIDVISILLMILFLYSGVSKLMDYRIFKEQIAGSPILSPIAPLIPIGLPVTEVIIALLLLLPRWRLWGLYISLGLLIIFTIYIVVILNFNRTLPCSCGGVLAELSWPQHIIFNTLFITLSTIAILLERRNRKQTTNLNWDKDQKVQLNA
jgi:uncharacterized membrane protein YphA (DoxX/SURF4 family)